MIKGFLGKRDQMNHTSHPHKIVSNEFNKLHLLNFHPSTQILNYFSFFSFFNFSRFFFKKGNLPSLFFINFFFQRENVNELQLGSHLTTLQHFQQQTLKFHVNKPIQFFWFQGFKGVKSRKGFFCFFFYGL